MSEPATPATAPAPATPVVTPPVPVEPQALVGFPHVTYTDLAVISVTSAGVSVAALAVILGLAAIVGWRAIRTSAKKEAALAGTMAMDKHLASSEFHAKLKLAVGSAVEEQIRDTVTITLQQTKVGGNNANRPAETFSE